MENSVLTDPSLHRPFNCYYEAIHKLRPVLPPPLEQTPEGYARRDNAVVEQIAQLVPASHTEVELAAKFVGAAEYAQDCMHLARQHQDDLAQHGQLLAQSARSGREARGFLASLLRLQTMRMKRERTEGGALQADGIENYARSLMTEALEDPPKPPGAAMSASAAEPPPAPVAALPPPETGKSAEPAAVPADPVAPAAEPVRSPHAPQTAPPPRFVADAVPVRRSSRPQRQADEDDWPQPNWAKEAEQYAIMYPRRAQLIRRLGGVPSNCSFGPPEPALVRAIVSSTSPLLRTLDET